MKKTICLCPIPIAGLLSVAACSESSDEPNLPVETRAASASESTQQSACYWYDGERIPLTVDTEKRFVLVDASARSAPLSADHAAGDAFAEVTLSPRIVPLAAARTAAPDRKTMWAVLPASHAETRAATGAELLYGAPCFRMEEGYEIGLNHLFCVKLRDKSDETVLLRLAADCGVEVIGYNEFMPLWYTLACDSASAGNALEMANRFYETGLFAAAEPSFVDGIELCAVANEASTIPSDRYFRDQWYLHNTGQGNGIVGLDIDCLNMREIIKGHTGPDIAVIDTGVFLEHDDLRVVPPAVSYDAVSGKSPCRVYDHHGTMCAGLISAYVDNRIGVAGIAPGCTVMPISVDIENADNPQIIADAFNYARLNLAGVISNSWLWNPPSAIIKDAIELALTEGRGGLGCVVVCASGNNNASSIVYPAKYFDDIIVVGAIDRQGKRAQFNSKEWSSYGSELYAVAPGVSIMTTDFTEGSDRTATYTCTFKGTSAACPQVAAVAGLIWTVSPKLTQQQVGNIINGTACKPGGYHLNKTDGFLRTYVPLRPSSFKQIQPIGSIRNWHIEVGYGMVDAFAAVKKALPGLYVKPITPQE